MLVFLLIMAAGFALGWALRDRPRPVAWAGRLTRPVILALLFLMGISIGLDDRTMQNLGALGLSSLGFAVATTVGSMGVLALVLPWLRDVPARRAATPEAEAAEAAIVREAEAEGEALLR